MQEPAPEAKPQKAPQEEKKKDTLRWLCILLTLLLVLSIGLSAWLWMQCEAEKKKLHEEKTALQTQIDALKKASPVTEADSKDGDAVACNDTPTESRKENIKAALDSKNTAAFATYVTNPVKYVLAASEYGGNVSPDEAATSLEYTHSATGPWDFNLPAATVAGYDAGFYTDYFDANTYVGRAASGMVTAFDFACDGKINQIFVAADEDLL